MSFDWKKYLELAECITKNLDKFPDKEACCRASVSRAYYAAFCTTCRILKETENFEYRRGGSHSDLQDYLQNGGDKLRRKIATRFKSFHFDRVTADYYDTIKRQSPIAMATKAIWTANKILEEVDALSKTT